MFLNRKLNISIVFCFLLILTGGQSFSQRSELKTTRAENPDQLLKRIQPAGQDWQIPQQRESDDRWSRLGKSGRPLTLHDSDGRRLGEIYQVRSNDTYEGFLMVSDKPESRSRFYKLSWPIEKVTKELNRYDLNNPLEEVDQVLVIDEDQLILRINRGTTELELPVMRFDPNE
jgi:hypothetical protein